MSVILLLKIILPVAVVGSIVAAVVIFSYRSGKNSETASCLRSRLNFLKAQDDAEKRMNEAQTQAPKTVAEFEEQLKEGKEGE